MLKTLVVQSYCEERVSGWIAICLDSVKSWASGAGYDYQFLGDELLSKVPSWYADKVAGRLPIVTDLGRLIWIAELLAEREYDRIVWLDADTLVFAPDGLRIDLSETCVFGGESWLQQDKKGHLKVYRNVHNAMMAFKAECPVLPFLIRTVKRLISEVDPQYIAPQMVGPKLLSSLHSLARFDVDERFGAISPLLARMIIDGEIPGHKIGRKSGEERRPMRAANLCLSLSEEIPHAQLVPMLLERAEGL